jgi:UDP-2,3-diacylglucosamine hydrolase
MTMPVAGAASADAHAAGAVAEDGASRPDTAQVVPTIRLDGAIWLASDLHLSASMPATREAFLAFLELAADNATALLLPGDLFDAWVGDDAIDAPPSWLAELLDGLARCARRIALYIGHGNRDFLMGEKLARRIGAQLLPDLVRIQAPGGAFLLCHGDELCTDDHAYQAFRQQVRSPSWQEAFLARPLAEREAIADGMRRESQHEQQTKSEQVMDVNQAAVEALLRTHRATRLIHGHTHRPDRHVFLLDDRRCERWVLPDWDLDARGAPRGGWMIADQDGLSIHDIELAD